MKNRIAQLIQKADGKETVKQKFLARVAKGQLTRKENPTSHLCVYFPAYDPKSRKIFIGHHKKSGLWLFNGGHMDPKEFPADAVIREAKEEWGMTLDTKDIPDPRLVTLTKIEHPEHQICEWHYDFWHFLRFDERAFHPDTQLLRIEFSEYGWKTYEESVKLFSDPNSFEALKIIQAATIMFTSSHRLK